MSKNTRRVSSAARVAFCALALLGCNEAPANVHSVVPVPADRSNEIVPEVVGESSADESAEVGFGACTGQPSDGVADMPVVEVTPHSEADDEALRLENLATQARTAPSSARAARAADDLHAVELANAWEAQQRTWLGNGTVLTAAEYAARKREAMEGVR